MKQLIWLAGAWALGACAAELPVRQVVLYKHGVGFFARSGELAAGESARLEFKAGEMDDVLKSLIVDETGGARISGLRYDSSEPLEHKLADFPFQIGAAQPLSAVLDQLKGARIELQFASETAAGAVVAARLVPGDDKRPEREQVTLLMDSGDLRNFDLGAAAAIRFSDPRLQAQFKTYLAVLTEARSKEKRAVYIDSDAARKRQIRASYLIPAAVWKSSYRLIFGDSGQPTLEGWAIVDNTTGEDWNQVDLALVSGRPVSFISRLYEPRYVTRQTAGLPEDGAAAPVVYEGAMGAVGGVTRSAMAAKAPAAAMPVNAENARFKRLQQPPLVSFVTPATGQDVGELFEYHIPAPVTVRRNESAMLPFLQQTIDTRKLLIYSDPSAAHPMDAAEISNSTGKTLDGGPITVYDGGAYAGEALMETLKSGDKRLIGYAVDLGARITTMFDTRAEEVRELHARRGILTTRSASVETKTYTIHNVDQKAKTLIIEHAARAGYTLLDRTPWERTATAYRFEVKLAPAATQKFPVTEERVWDSSYTVTDLTPDVLLTYVRNKTLSDAGRRQLEHIATLKQQAAAAARDIERLDGQVAEIVNDEQRLRQNIGSLNPVGGQQQQVQAYARRLGEAEVRIAALRDQRAESESKRVRLESEIAAAIEALAF